MDKVIARATDSINKILESSRLDFSDAKYRLIDIRKFLNQLLKPNLPRNDGALLFGRQLRRLMDYNDLLQEYFWTELHQDILYLVQEPNGVQDKGSWKNFCKRIEFERKLEQRESQFQQTLREQKSLHQLFCEHKTFFEEYLQKCISLHSKMQVPGLIEIINDLLSKLDGPTEFSLTSENQKCLKEKLRCIEITLDCPNRSLKSLRSQFSTYDNSYTKVNNNLSNFLPSIEQIKIDSVKTTVLRWITRIFAEAALREDEKVTLEENGSIPVRIPILLRIGEFAAWLDRHQTKTLIDYIGEHTWFSEQYCHDDRRNALNYLEDEGVICSLIVLVSSFAKLIDLY